MLPTKDPEGLPCQACGRAATFLLLLMREITTNDSLDLVALDRDKHCVPFGSLYVACEICADTGQMGPSADAQAATLAPTYPSRVSATRLDNPPADVVMAKPPKPGPTEPPQ